MPDAEVLVSLAVLLPLAGAVLAFAIPRQARGVALAAGAANLLCGLGLLRAVIAGGPLRLALGGWPVPVGIALGADALSALFVAVGAVVAWVASLPARIGDARAWPCWLLLVAALNAVVLTRDLFNMYVALELLALAAVGLVALGHGRTAAHGALEYLVASALGSGCILLGVALVYGARGTLALDALARSADPLPPAAGALLTVGLLVKMAVVPLHGWLPLAHSAAPTPASAALSGLVVKAPFYLLLRLWVGAGEPPVLAPAAAGTLPPVLAVLGAAGIGVGVMCAWRAERLKLAIAYSTVAQLGYLALFLPLAARSAPAAAALVLLALAHALAKSAMFLAAGGLAEAAGHDRIADLPGSPSTRPAAVAAFALAGITVIGLPPSAAFGAKVVLLERALADGAWWLAACVVLGTLGAAGYVFRVLDRCLVAPVPGADAPPAGRILADLPALGLALGALLLLAMTAPLLAVLGGA